MISGGKRWPRYSEFIQRFLPSGPHFDNALLTQAALLNLMLPIMNDLQDSPALDLKRKFSEGKVTYG